MTSVARHFIATRFFCIKMSIDILDEKILKRGFDNMKRWFIPSLNNQTNKNFTLVILRYKDANMNGINGLLPTIKDECDFHVDIIDYEKFGEYLFDNTENGQKSIISRVDSDDSMRKDIVQDTLDALSKSSYDISFYGYDKGYEQDISNPYKLKTFDKNYRHFGSFSVMQSIMVDYRKNMLQPYMWQHTNFYGKMQTLGIKKYFFKVDRERRMFIRNFTGINTSYVNKRYEPGKYENITKEKITDLFGI